MAETAHDAAAWEPVIGMEVHVQLATRSKMFCGCSADYLAKPPNANVCPICLGMPGVLPVINRRAVEQVVKTALALNCEIPSFTKFDRKNYFYPDLPKGYQISQYDLPLSRAGVLEVAGRTVRITRAHLEEDTGKLVHAGDQLHSAGESYVDLNRAGVPLMEVVSEPDLHSAAEARDYAIALRGLLRYIGASEADMEKGQLRAEANVSVRRAGQSELGTKTELKNINSFRALQRAIQFEIERQISVLESGGEVVQETRGWSEAEQRTFSQRTKEFAQDYRYFPEPDLPPLELDPAWIDDLRRSLPELPQARTARLVAQHSLPEAQVRLLTADPETAEYLEQLIGGGADALLATNWMVSELLSVERAAWPAAGSLSDLLKMLGRGELNRDQARQVQQEMISSGEPPAAIAERSGLRQLSDTAELGAVIDSVIAENPRAVADFAAGKHQAIQALVGQVMKATRGSANPALVSQMLRERLSL